MKKSLASLGLGALLIGAVTVGAPSQANAVFVDVGPGSPLSLPFTSGPGTPPDIVVFSPTPADRVLWNEDLPPPMNQNAETIRQSIITEFSETDPIALVGQSSITDGDSGITGTYNGGAGTVNSTTPFNYLAIHYDAKELYFYWDTPITSFTIGDGNGGQNSGDLNQDISNYRAYNVVPIPGAVWLFGTALVGFAAFARKKKMAAA